jgi:hypothetical protein
MRVRCLMVAGEEWLLSHTIRDFLILHESWLFAACSWGVVTGFFVVAWQASGYYSQTMLYPNPCILKITRLLCTRQKPEFYICSNTITCGLTHPVISTMAVQTSLAIVLSGLMKCLSESWDVGTGLSWFVVEETNVCDQSSMNVWSFLGNN